MGCKASESRGHGAGCGASQVHTTDYNASTHSKPMEGTSVPLAVEDVARVCPCDDAQDSREHAVICHANEMAAVRLKVAKCSQDENDSVGFVLTQIQSVSQGTVNILHTPSTRYRMHARAWPCCLIVAYMRSKAGAKVSSLAS